jgi:hypothetical protein
MLIKFVILVITIQAVACEHESGKRWKQFKLIKFSVFIVIAKRCARAAGSCLLASEVTEGPYYWNSTVRRDIT